MEDRVPTYGEKAVGLSFNSNVTSGDDFVRFVKEQFALLIDRLDEARQLEGFLARMLQNA